MPLLALAHTGLRPKPNWGKPMRGIGREPWGMKAYEGTIRGCWRGRRGSHRYRCTHLRRADDTDHTRARRRTRYRKPTPPFPTARTMPPQSRGFSAISRGAVTATIQAWAGLSMTLGSTGSDTPARERHAKDQARARGLSVSRYRYRLICNNTVRSVIGFR